MLNPKFKERMKELLGKDYDAFIYAIENEDAVRGVRVNSLKPNGSLSEELVSHLTKIPYTPDGYVLEGSLQIGNTPEHHCGIIYVQDPGAMATLSALDIGEDWKILDLCAAPGGKSGQAAARAKNGVIFSNEFVPKRAKITVGNFERLGIRNAVVTSLDTAELPKLFDSYFDLVIADVPCSGEGMFRKSSEALSEWSEENVLQSSIRGKSILYNGAPTVKCGGYLIFSTCTYSLEENESVLDSFLSDHPDFELVEVKKELVDATSDGISIKGSSHDLSKARRFYPHISRGEGQFLALLKRKGDTSPAVLYKDSAKEPSKAESAAVRDFFKKYLTREPDGRLAKVGENLVLISHSTPIPPKSVFSSGVLVGTVEKGLLFPSHQLFSAYGELFKHRENLLSTDERIKRYLRGEEIDAREIDGTGWCAVLYNGSSLGGGKASGGKIKNHYPKGLRLKG